MLRHDMLYRARRIEIGNRLPRLPIRHLDGVQQEMHEFLVSQVYRGRLDCGTELAIGSHLVVASVLQEYRIVHRIACVSLTDFIALVRSRLEPRYDVPGGLISEGRLSRDDSVPDDV